MSSKKDSASSVCPCGSGLALIACCGRWHAGVAAPDAERLMRSRYSAYVLGLEDYLLATWHVSTRPTSLGLADDTGIKWLGLTVLSFTPADKTAQVHFVARYKVGGRAYRLQERSHFVLEENRWFYVDGVIES